MISSVDNFLRPKLVGERVRLDELVMFFSVLGGLQVFVCLASSPARLSLQLRVP